jgi:hypothetical protein
MPIRIGHGLHKPYHSAKHHYGRGDAVTLRRRKLPNSSTHVGISQRNTSSHLCEKCGAFRFYAVPMRSVIPWKRRTRLRTRGDWALASMLLRSIDGPHCPGSNRHERRKVRWQCVANGSPRRKRGRSLEAIYGFTHAC